MDHSVLIHKQIVQIKNRFHVIIIKLNQSNVFGILSQTVVWILHVIMLQNHIIVILNVLHLYPLVQLNLEEDAQKEHFVERPKIGLLVLQIFWGNSVIGAPHVKLNLAI